MSKKTSPVVSLLQSTCVWYSGISLLVLVINVILSTNEKTYVSPLDFLLFFPFALCMALATLVRRTSKLTAAARVVLHPICVLGGFVLFVFLPSSQSPVMLLLAAVIYGITVFVLWLRARRNRQKEVDNTPYISQFGQKS